MIEFESRGNFKKLTGFFEKVREIFDVGILDKYGKRGVEALQAATPKDTGLLSSSWYYDIKNSKGVATITWSNSDIEGGCNVAILIQYGHGVKGGGYVQGIDFINPALEPIFMEILEDAIKEVKSL